MTGNAPRRGSDQSDAAAYIADMTANLATMARRHGLGTLGYLLDMARMEAKNAAEADVEESS
jgi:hypothetical protein